MNIAFPIWLIHSGLPQQLLAATRCGCAWSVFRTLVELDTQLHQTLPASAPIDITLTDLADRAGTTPRAAKRALLALRRLKVAKSYIPDTLTASALIHLQVPIPVPRPRAEILADLRRLYPTLMPKPDRFTSSEPIDPFLRYLDLPRPTSTRRQDDVLSEVVDLYLDTCGTAMNSFIIDTLSSLSTRYPLELIQREFRRAKDNEIHSLQEITRAITRAGSTQRAADTFFEERP